MLIALGWGKATGEFVKTGFAQDTKAIAGETWPYVRTFLEHIVLPNANTFAWLLALSEIAVGIGLVLGLLTRVAAAGGVALMLAILMGTGRGEPGATWDQWVTAGMTAKFTLLLLLLLCAVDPGKVWGLDGVLQRRKRSPRRSPT